MLETRPSLPVSLVKLLWQGHRTLWLMVIVLSLAVNVLLLTGPLYMLQVYDRVLTSRSIETLVALSLLAAMLFAGLGILDHCRGRLVGLIVARLRLKLDPAVFRAALASPGPPGQPMADLEVVERALASPLVTSLLDLPWTPLFLALLFLLHPLLGWVAVAGGTGLLVLACLQRVLVRGLTERSAAASATADGLAAQFRREGELLRALTMTEAAQTLWQGHRLQAVTAGLRAGRLAGLLAGMERAFRLLLQSAMLGFGAWLVLRDSLSPGAMVAASILVGRVLAPVECLTARLPLALRAADGWHRVARLLADGELPPARPVPPASRPHTAAALDCQQVTLCLPGRAEPVLRNIAFQLHPGQALGIVGPSGSGKSTLLRALAGLIEPANGRIRLGEHDIARRLVDKETPLVGYLPQRATLFEGSVSQNIARLSPEPLDLAQIIAAAQLAGAHEMILGLPQGYATPLEPGGAGLSGGQAQRIALARALWGNPGLVILDEPTAGLDATGIDDVRNAVEHLKEIGKIVMVASHSLAALRACDQLLWIEGGQARMFGQQQAVLQQLLGDRAQASLRPLVRRSA